MIYEIPYSTLVLGKVFNVLEYSFEVGPYIGLFFVTIFYIYVFFIGDRCTKIKQLVRDIEEDQKAAVSLIEFSAVALIYPALLFAVSLVAILLFDIFILFLPVLVILYLLYVIIIKKQCKDG